MAKYKVKGIILKRTNLGEADRILTIFTDKMGKIKAIGKGIRKQNSRLGGHLEPFCLGNLVIAEGRNLDLICEAEISECFFELRNNLQSTRISYYLAETVDKLTAEHEKHGSVFELLLEVLNSISQLNNDILLSYFELNSLSELGFKPELDHCVSCHGDLTIKDNAFDNSEGGLVCGRCVSGGPKISPNAIKLLRLFLKYRLKRFKKIKTTEETLKEVRKIIQNYLDYTSGQEFKSRKFVYE